nr:MULTISPECIES: hypothetical protein [unclassified Ruminococcus]
MLLSEPHPQKAVSPILVTLSEMVILFNDLQNEKAPSVILVTLSGIVTLPEQYFPSFSILFIITRGFSSCLFFNHGVSEKADSPIFVTLLGIVMLCNDLHFKKA